MWQHPNNKIGLLFQILVFAGLAPAMTETPKPGVVPDLNSRPGKRVPLHLEDEFGAIRLAEPVTTGLPFPSGVLADAEHVRILDPSGKEIPSQRRVLARWKDGSVKWLLLDFRATMTGNGKVTYELEYGPEVRAGTVTDGLQIQTQRKWIQVDPGRARFSFRRDRFELFEEFAVDQNGNGWFGNGEKVIRKKAGGDAFIELEYQAPGPPQEENWLLDAAGSPREVFLLLPQKQSFLSRWKNRGRCGQSFSCAENTGLLQVGDLPPSRFALRRMPANLM